MPSKITISDLFSLSETIAADIFSGCDYPWEVLPKIKPYITALGATLPPDAYDHPAEDIWIARSATVYTSAHIQGPCIIDQYAEIRHCALFAVRLLSAPAPSWHSTELKMSFCSMMYRCPITIMSAIPYSVIKRIWAGIHPTSSPILLRCASTEKSWKPDKNSALCWGLCRDRLQFRFESRYNHRQKQQSSAVPGPRLYPSDSILKTAT